MRIFKMSLLKYRNKEKNEWKGREGGKEGRRETEL